MTILISHQAVPPHFTTKLRLCNYTVYLQEDAGKQQSIQE